MGGKIGTNGSFKAFVRKYIVLNLCDSTGKVPLDSINNKLPPTHDEYLFVYLKRINPIKGVQHYQ